MSRGKRSHFRDKKNVEIIDFCRIIQCTFFTWLMAAANSLNGKRVNLSLVCVTIRVTNLLIFEHKSDFLAHFVKSVVFAPVFANRAAQPKKETLYFAMNHRAVEIFFHTWLLKFGARAFLCAYFRQKFCTMKKAFPQCNWLTL